jgi:hypothetical protein
LPPLCTTSNGLIFITKTPLSLETSALTLERMLVEDLCSVSFLFGLY